MESVCLSPVIEPIRRRLTKITVCIQRPSKREVLRAGYQATSSTVKLELCSLFRIRLISPGVKRRWGRTFERYAFAVFSHRSATILFDFNLLFFFFFFFLPFFFHFLRLSFSNKQGYRIDFTRSHEVRKSTNSECKGIGIKLSATF